MLNPKGRPTDGRVPGSTAGFGAEGWGGVVSFPALKSACPKAGATGPRSPGHAPPQQPGDERTTPMPSWCPLLLNHILESGIPEFPPQIVLTMLLGPEQIFLWAYSPSSDHIIDVCSPGPKG